MRSLSVICLALYTVAALVIGVRLLLLARRSHGLPERLMGWTYLASPGLGYPLIIVASLLPRGPAALVVFAVGQLGIVLGFSCFLFFNAKVFRAEARWAVAAACIGTFMLVATGVGGVSFGAEVVLGRADPATFAETGRIFVGVLLLVAGACYAWTGFEGFRYFGMMRRRVALGLGDPLLSNRFLLWGISGLTSSTWNAVALAYLLAGQNILQEPVPILVRAVGGLLNSVLLVLIFMAPSSYTRWVSHGVQGVRAEA